MSKLTRDERIQVLKQLLEGSSVSSTVRLTDISMPTILKLLVDVGEVCAETHDRLVRGVRSRRVQADEIWSYVGMKQKNTDEIDRACGKGDSWTWLAIDADHKLIISYLVADRGEESAKAFIGDLAARLANRVQLTTDGLKVYLDAVENAFGCDVDYAQLVKQYAAVIEGQKRYSPAECCGATKTTVTGNPNRKDINTSFVERVNLTVRMQDRRFTRLTNGFSKKLENHIASVHLHMFAYNFVRMHKTLRMTPAMAAGLTDRLWGVEEIVALLEAKEEKEALAARSAKPAKPTIVRSSREYKAIPLTPIKVNGRRVGDLSDQS